MEQDDVDRICKRVVDPDLDTQFLADQFELSRRRVQQLAKEYEHVTPNPNKQGRRRPWVRFERDYAGVTVHMDWYQNDRGDYVLGTEDDASRFVLETTYEAYDRLRPNPQADIPEPPSTGVSTDE